MRKETDVVPPAVQFTDTAKPSGTNSLPTRPLGRTGIRLTILGLGGSALGNHGCAVEENAALATVSSALDLGVRYFDVAPLYGHGLAEHRFGQVLRQRPRSEYILSTKVGRLLRPALNTSALSQFYIDPLPFDLVDDYSGDAILRSVEDSLQRLGLNRIDILYIHNIDAAKHSPDELEKLFSKAMKEAYPALDRLRSEGTVGSIGVGNNFTEMCERFARAGDFDSFMLAGRYTLLRQEPLDSFLPLCAARGIGVAIASPFNGGLLALGPDHPAFDKDRRFTPDEKKRVRSIDSVCHDHGIPLAAAAIQFPLGHQSVASVVSGPRSAKEIADNAAWLQMPISPAFWADLKTLGLLRPDAPTTNTAAHWAI